MGRQRRIKLHTTPGTGEQTKMKVVVLGESEKTPEYQTPMITELLYIATVLQQTPLYYSMQQDYTNN